MEAFKDLDSDGPVRGVDSGIGAFGSLEAHPDFRNDNIQEDSGRGHRLQILQELSHEGGIKTGYVSDLLKLSASIDTADVNSVVFLEEAKGMFSRENIPVRGIDYRIIVEKAGSRVQVCQSENGRLFVTKLIPLVKDRNGRMGLENRQQIDLVVANQDDIPKIARIFGLAKRTIGGHVYGEVFMKLYEGGTLQYRLEQKQLSDLVQWRCACQIISFLKDLHDADIIYGNMKANHIIFDDLKKTNIHMVDFRQTKHCFFPYEQDFNLNTPAWWEYPQGFDAGLLKKLDMWSAGKVLAELLMIDHLPLASSVKKRLDCLIYGLKTHFTSVGQLTADEALLALDDNNVVVAFLRGDALQAESMGALVLESGKTITDLVRHPGMDRIIKQTAGMKPVFPDLQDGYWLSQKQVRLQGPKHVSVQKTMVLNESVAIYVHAPLGMKK